MSKIQWEWPEDDYSTRRHNNCLDLNMEYMGNCMYKLPSHISPSREVFVIMGGTSQLQIMKEVMRKMNLRLELERATKDKAIRMFNLATGHNLTEQDVINAGEDE